MRRPLGLSLSRLESREVPAAGLFADIRPGVWGSYPQSITASGGSLFFSAETTLGNELYATDGTAAGTHLVKDIRAGSVGSNPQRFFAAGGGVIFFSADDGSGRTLWKSDGTAAGTAKVTGVPDAVLTLGGNYIPGSTVLANGGTDTVGWKGELYLVTRNMDTGRIVWGKTNGISFTELTDFQGTAGVAPAATPAMRVNGSLLELTWLDTAGNRIVWQTDGTPAGTTVQQANLTATSPSTGTVALDAGVEIAPGKYIFRSVPTNGTKVSVWVGDGTTAASRQLLKVFDGSPYGLFGSDPIVAAGGKVFFTVDSNSFPKPADVGVWVTDGTAEGTTKLDVPAAGSLIPKVLGAFGDKVLVQGYQTVGPATPPVYRLTDGTAVGTITVPRPPDTPGSNWVYSSFAGTLPTDAANPKGVLLFQEGLTGRVYRTDGTTAGTAEIDRTGLPPATVPPGYYRATIQNWGGGTDVRLDPAQSSNQYGVGRGAYFNGAVYYSGQTATDRPELWKWNLEGTTPPPVTAAPKVTGTKVNDGSTQRSMVKTLTVTFDSSVTVNPAGVTILNARGDTPAFTQQLTTVNGVTTLTVTFPNGVGGSIADGRWTLRIDDAAVKTQAGGTKMAADYSFVFTRVYGDTSGDGIYDRSTRLLVQQLLGQEVGDPGYHWDLDVNSDGKIDGADELAAIRNWGKAV